MLNIRHCEEHSDEAIQDRADMESAPTMNEMINIRHCEA